MSDREKRIRDDRRSRNRLPHLCLSVSSFLSDSTTKVVKPVASNAFRRA